jgi:hypothetical protein
MASCLAPSSSWPLPAPPCSPSGSTRAPPARLTTASWACSCLRQRQGQSVHRPGAVPAPLMDRRLGALPGRAGARGNQVSDQAAAGPRHVGRALDARVPAAWVTADEAHGGDPALRRWLEGRGVAHVLAVKCTEPLAVAGPVRIAAEQLAVGVPAERWVGCSAGDGAKGHRLYDWTRVALTPPATAGMGRWLLMRRSRSDGKLAFYACYGPVATPLIGLLRVARQVGGGGGFRAGQEPGRPGPLRGA